MKNYYIYHIAGIKIGCTVNVPHRMREQGFTEWEHLETHTDIYEASNREIELQKEYGYPVDNVPYWQAVENRLSASSAGGIASYKNGVSELRKTIYVNQGRLMGLANKGKKKTHSRITCPHCNKEGGSNNMKRWHFDNCKLA